MKKIFILCGLLMSCSALSAQDRKRLWTDSVFQTLSLPEKIGQLFMVQIPANLSKEEEVVLSNKIKTYAVGGLYITRGGPVRLATLLNRLQNNSRVPMLTGIKAGRGLGQTLDSTMRFLCPMALGALRQDSAVYDLGKTIAQQMRMVGLHINFAPTASLYAGEPNYQDYLGDNRNRVAEKYVNWIKGLQDQGVIACSPWVTKSPAQVPAKNDTVGHPTSDQADTTELDPQFQLVRHGIAALLTNELNRSVTGKEKGVPAYVSANEILKKKIGFTGLTFIQIPESRVSGKNMKGENERMAFMAGNDVLIVAENLGEAVNKIVKEVGRNAVFMAQLDTSVKKILRAKFDVGLDGRRRIDTDNLVRRLNSPGAHVMQEQLVEASVSVVRNAPAFIPVQFIEGKNFASLALGAGTRNEWNRYLAKYALIKKLSVRNGQDTVGMEDRLRASDVIIVGVFPGFELQTGILHLLRRLASQKEVILCHFGNPMELKYFEFMPSVIAAYSDDDLTRRTVSEIIFGGLGSQGVLPVRVPGSLSEGEGLISLPFDRLSFSLPEAVGMDSRTLDEIQSIAAEAIDMKALPGCHILVAKNKKIVYERSFGSLMYDNKTPVTDTTLYDLASVTKVSATLQAVMFMYEKGLIDINKKASVYLPELKNSNKKDFIIKDILTHQAGLWPFLPFWTETMKDSIPLPAYYSTTASADYPFPVAANLFAAKSMKDSLWHWIIKARIRDKTGHTPFDYRYSDMGFYILQHLAEKILGEPMENFLQHNLYEPLGAYTTGYLPLRRFPETQIAPTEDDKLFRKSLLIGYVHDQGAAMHGGIAGHAGLFSTANDLAKLGQMWLQKGDYGHRRYFKPETLDFFTQKQYEGSRRGLGWDKPALSDPNGPTSLLASPKTFGHTGFTGISIWVDPEFDLVFIFFSNRVYPDMTNNKILNANIRPRIQDVVYKSIFRYCENHN